jgi:hypothetical protein
MKVYMVWMFHIVKHSNKLDMVWDARPWNKADYGL